MRTDCSNCSSPEEIEPLRRQQRRRLTIMRSAMVEYIMAFIIASGFVYP